MSFVKSTFFVKSIFFSELSIFPWNWTWYDCFDIFSWNRLLNDFTIFFVISGNFHKFFLLLQASSNKWPNTTPSKSTLVSLRKRETNKLIVDYATFLKNIFGKSSQKKYCADILVLTVREWLTRYTFSVWKPTETEKIPWK